MRLSRRALLGAAAGAGASVAVAPRARAQSKPLKVGLLTDMSGPYRDIGGPLAVAAAQQAIAEFTAAHGVAVDFISADTQNKPDIGAGVARQWFDQEGVDFLTGVPNSAVALAVAGVAREKNKVYANTGAATSDLTGPKCNANTIHWSYDTWMLARSTGGATVRTGADTWFFITADYAFGHALQRDTTGFITAAGGAKVIGLCNAGADTVNSIKQAHEFGVTQTLAGMLVFISDVHALSLDVAQGLLVTETFYWDLNDRTRALSARMLPRAPDKRMNMDQAGGYAATLHYLKVATAMGVAQAKADGAATVARMKSTPTDDDAFGPGMIRLDGRTIHPSYLFQVKKPDESKGPWDYYKLLATTPADQAFRPLAQGGCPLVKA
jgi:branched-chain amino acid transport system substrate-binding protein